MEAFLCKNALAPWSPLSLCRQGKSALSKRTGFPLLPRKVGTMMEALDLLRARIRASIVDACRAGLSPNPTKTPSVRGSRLFSPTLSEELIPAEGRGFTTTLAPRGHRHWTPGLTTTNTSLTREERNASTA